MTKNMEQVRARRREASKRFRKNNPDYYKGWMKKNPDYFNKHYHNNPTRRERQIARSTLNVYLKKGYIKKKFVCYDCDKKTKKTFGHHHDYSKPLSVVWLCLECHGKRHWKL